MIRFPPFKLDTRNHCVWREPPGGPSERLELPPKTFDVLRYLAESAGRLVGHDELLDALWPDHAVQPEVLKGHILAIRQALGDQARTPRFIATQRGRGYRFVAALEAAPALAPAVAAPPAPAAFVGRTRELAALHAALAAASAGAVRIVFIHGEPGIGKTTLIDCFLAQVSLGAPLRLASGHAIESYASCEPYYPVFEALGQLVRNDHNGGVLKALLAAAPSWALQLPGLLTAEHSARLQRQLGGLPRNRLLGEIGDFIALLSTERPLVLVLEDLHWADYSTLDMLSALARRAAGARLLLIASYRRESAAYRGHPVAALAQTLLLQQQCVELALPPLAKAELSALIGPVSDAAQGGLADYIARQAGGNPLFAGLILEHLQQRKLVRRQAAGWELLTPLDQLAFTLPVTLSNIVELQARQLSARQQTLLECGSVFGRSFDAGGVAALEALEPAAVEQELELLSHSCMFIARGETVHAEQRLPFRRYLFTHAAYHAVFQARQAPTRRAQRHLTAARHLCTVPGAADEQLLAELARHFEAAGEYAQALAQLHGLLAVAKKRFAHRDALAIIDHAEAMLAKRPGTPAPETLSWLAQRASVQAASHDPAAQASYTRLVEQAQQCGDVDTHTRALLGLAFVHSWHDAARCLAVLEQARQVSAAQQDAAQQLRTRISCCVWKVWVGGWDRAAVQETEQLAAALRAPGQPAPNPWSMVEYSMLCLLSARYREAQELINHNLALLLQPPAGQPDYDSIRVVSMVSLGVPWSDLLMGKLGASLARFDANIAMLEKNASRYSANRLRLMRALLLMHALDFEAMLAECAIVRRTFSDLTGDPDSRASAALPGEQRTCQLMQGVAQAGLGRAEQALALLLPVEQEMLARPINFDWYRLLLLEWALADTYLLQDQLELARQRAASFLARARATDEACWHALAWDALARVALRQGDLAGARAHIAPALAAVEAYAIPLAAWRVYRSAAAIHARSGEPALADQQAARGARCRQELIASLPPQHPLRHSLAAGLPPLA